MKIVQINSHEWSVAFHKCRTSNYFFSPDWMQIQATTFQLINLFYLIEVEERKLYIPFQKNNQQLFSNYIAYGGFMLEDGASCDSDILLAVINEVEIQTGCKLSRLKTYPLISYTTNNKVTMQNTAVLSILDSQEAQLEHIHSNNKYQVKRSIAKEVYTKQLSLSEADVFYKLYIETMKRVGSKYLTPFSLFEFFLNSNDIITLGAYIDKKLIAGGVFPCCRNGVFYLINASSEKGRMLSANYLITSDIIQKSRKDSRTFLNFGSSHSDSILKVKLRWGAKPTQYISIET